MNVCRLALKCDGAWVHHSGARQFCGKPCKGCKRRSISYILDNRHIPEKKKLSKCYCKAWGTKIITSERSIVEKACESCLDVITFSSLLSSSLCLLSSLPPVFVPILLSYHLSLAHHFLTLSISLSSPFPCTFIVPSLYSFLISSVPFSLVHLYLLLLIPPFLLPLFIPNILHSSLPPTSISYCPPNLPSPVLVPSFLPLPS